MLAKALLGTYLVVRTPHDKRDDALSPLPPGHAGHVRVVRIVETEAYRGPKDLASHARAGLTKRTRTLLGPHGHAYVYLIYGMYDCFNVVCFGEGTGHAVLVRAGEPVLGIASDIRTDGPGRLARALGLTRAHDAVDLVESNSVYLLPRSKRPKVGVSARVGVAYAGEIAEAPWRFFDAESRFVSRPPAKSIGLGLRKDDGRSD
ncbi:DNA-3-methyladenine glycosylase II [Labilithrix luteola]|uniref:Putative 3-methyladenine DNA glycosylase n=1 Tax=Labilithrix luteola TaxID=1391654 RepID=A0A0K1Q9T4_9BACT|nr:DNA-3-methyladenine glycosylase II [Labilithrix luteola]